MLGHTSFSGLRQSLRNQLDLTADSRDAEVQRRIVLRLKAAIPKGERRECNALLMKLRSRQRAANKSLAEYLCSDAGCEQLRRMNKDLSALQVAHSTADLTRLVSRRYRSVLHDIEKLLAHKIATGRRVHPLRDALGDWHDAMLLARWIHESALTLTPSLRCALDTLLARCRKRCKRHRKPLRHAIRQFLANEPAVNDVQ